MPSRTNYRPRVGRKIKEALIKEAGGKCANPGCPNLRVHFHHIQEWHVYKRHKREEMIAVCPTCHDHAHRGPLKIDDETIRLWKGLARIPTNRGYFYIEPSSEVHFLFGTLLLSAPKPGPMLNTVFDLSARNQLGFRVEANDLVGLYLSICDSSDNVILKIVNGHLEHHAREVLGFDSRPGRVRVRAPATAEFLPQWIVRDCFGPDKVLQIADGQFTLLDLEVRALGLVQVQGVWTEDRRALVVGSEMLAFSRGDPDWGDGFVYWAGYREQIGDGGTATIRFDGMVVGHSLSRNLTGKPGW